MRRKGATILHRRPLSPSLTASVALALVLFAAGLLAGGPASAEVPAASASDPVVGEVVRLLEAGLGEPLVQRWLDDSGKIPALPTADDLIALKKAGASDKLIAALLDRASAHAPATPAAAEPTTTPVPAPAAAPGRAPAPAVPAPAPDAPVVTAPAATPFRTAAPAPAPEAAAAGAAAVLVDASILYIHVPEEGEPWDLVVYLDGRPFAPVAAARSTSSAQTWTSQRPLAPGPHILRWAQERHRDRKGEIGLHAARFDPEPLYFAIAPGSRGAIEFEFRDSSGFIVSRSGPVKVRVTEDGRELASRSSSGDPAMWPLLCEEIEANAGGKKPGFNDRQALRHCVRWADLWKEVPDAPGRDAVRPAVR
ncbi:MAG: hypothetical protein KBA72_06710 [Thermoanaerobaculia bacterium]|nr:hypothetical protein [Thermoanaerobaculia bacterium]